MLQRLLFILSLVFLSAFPAYSQLTINPNATTPTPTCLGRLYSDLIIPGQYPDGNTFIQSPEGTLGVTIFFEIGPSGEPGTEGYTGTEAMIGVGETSINRFRNNDSVQNVNDHGEISKGGIIAVIKESDAWHHETYHGEGTLLEGQRNRFYSILDGDPHTQDCGGLVWSLIVGENVIQQYNGGGGGHIPPQAVDLSTIPAHLALYYGSSSFGNEQLPGVSTVNQQYVQSAGAWSVPTQDLIHYPGGFYSENFFLLSNAVVRSGFFNFI
jgi:hypothetical protein